MSDFDQVIDKLARGLSMEMLDLLAAAEDHDDPQFLAVAAVQQQLDQQRLAMEGVRSGLSAKADMYPQISGVEAAAGMSYDMINLLADVEDPDDPGFQAVFEAQMKLDRMRARERMGLPIVSEEDGDDIPPQTDGTGDASTPITTTEDVDLSTGATDAAETTTTGPLPTFHPFMKLPAEIKNQILSFCDVSSNIGTCCGHCNSGPELWKCNCHFNRATAKKYKLVPFQIPSSTCRCALAHPLLRASRALREQVLLSMVNKRVTIGPVAHEDLAARFNHVASNGLTKAKNIEIIIPLESLSCTRKFVETGPTSSHLRNAPEAYKREAETIIGLIKQHCFTADYSNQKRKITLTLTNDGPCAGRCGPRASNAQWPGLTWELDVMKQAAEPIGLEGVLEVRIRASQCTRVIEEARWEAMNFDGSKGFVDTQCANELAMMAEERIIAKMRSDMRR